MSSYGAKAALEGYRKQALYTVASILQANGSDLVFQPEGIEDLAVYQGPRPLRAVQVKAHSENLTLSSFSPDKPKSFFHRAAKDLATHDGLTIEVISFGPIGAEITGAWSGNTEQQASVRAKLRGYKFNNDQIDALFSRVKWQRADEGCVQKQVFEFLRDSAVTGDPESAFSLLTAWIYLAAEKKQRITYSDLVEKLNAIGRYSAERSAQEQEWFTSIVPIEDKPIDTSRNEQLAEEFYNGISTRYSHILAGFDVPRHDRLNSLEQAFSPDTRTVIIHGASGQGKTTLALRFLHDFVPEQWRYSIRYLQDKGQIARVANALAGHLRVVNAPLYLHLDVSPRDHDWPELVKNLLDEKNIRILITIREEDLARNTISDAELGFPQTIPITFNEGEARDIYERLLGQGVAASFPSFEDAWALFGGEGPLLEFVYFITQAESLQDRLHNQVLRLREEVRLNTLLPEELMFMRVCSVASAFEARVDAPSLAAELKLKNPIRTLQLLEEEYLLRSTHDRRYVEALHPIRSAILARELTDPTFEPWRDAAILAINHMPEPDIEPFLLYAFARRTEDVEFLVEGVGRYCPKAWSGVAAVMRALLWLGVKEYVEANMLVIAEARALFSHAWYMALMCDVSGMYSDGDAGLLEAFKQLGFSAEKIESLRSKQTDRDSVFTRLTAWISKNNCRPYEPQNALEWAGFAEAHFWVRRLNVETAMVDAVASLDLSWPLSHLSMTGLGEVILSLSYSSETTFKDILDPFQRQVMERFCSETKTIAIEETEGAIRAHYLVPMGSPTNQEDEKDPEQTGNQLESNAIKLLNALHMFYPKRNAYSVQGYGHNLRFLPLPFDLSTKGPVESRYLLPGWPVKLNGIFRNLGDLSFRGETWKEYAEAVLKIREQVVLALTALVKALTAYYAGNRAEILSKKLPQELWTASSSAVNQKLSLPKIAVDEWGLVGEGAKISTTESAMKSRLDTSKSLVVQAYQPYLKAKSEYLSSLGNYFNQSIVPMVVNSNVGRMKSKTDQEAFLERASELGYKAGSDRLSLYNLGDAWKALDMFQVEFAKLLSGFVDKEMLQRLETQERRIYPNVWALWYKFVNHPEGRCDSANIRAVAALERAQNKLRDNIKGELHALSSSGVACSIHDEAVLWKGRPGLWLVVNAQSALALFEAFARILLVLEEAFTPIEFGSLEHYVLDMKWSHILIVPHIAGEYWGNGVWPISSCLFGSGQKINPEDTLRFVPQEVDATTLSDLGIATTGRSTPDKIKLLQQATSELLVYVDHMSDLLKVPDDLNEVGKAIFEKHVASKAQDASRALSNAVEQVQALLNEIEAGALDTSPYLDEIKRLLVAIWADLFPDAFDKDCNEMEIHLSACGAWAEKILQALGHMTFLNHFCQIEGHNN